MRALGRLPKGTQNKTEAAYEDRVLKPAMLSGDVAVSLGGVKLRLADKTFYEPDFFVMRRNGELEVSRSKVSGPMTRGSRSRSPLPNIRSSL